jgi:hypothetical protein
MAGRLALVLIAMTAMVADGACSAEGDNNYDGGTIEVVLDETSPSAVMLHVSNQSYEDSEVTIDVTIDGKSIIDRTFDVGNQHNWIPFLIRLAPGGHTLEAASSTGATYSTSFEVADSAVRYAALSYWYYPPSDDGSDPTPRSFTFTIQDDEIGFA